MQIEGTYSANEKHWANRSPASAAMQLPRSCHSKTTFAARIVRQVFDLLDSSFMAERSQRSTRNSRLALQPHR